MEDNHFFSIGFSSLLIKKLFFTIFVLKTFEQQGFTW